MVTRAAKDLLRNTIRHMDFHNRLREEEEMWKHWEMGKGLTMMVTDDFLRKRYSSNKRQMSARDLSRHKREARKCTNEMGNVWNRRLMDAEENDPERWGHSGYKEMYPNEFKTPSPSPSRDSSTDSSDSSSTDRSSRKHRKVKRHKKPKRRKSETRKRRRDDGHVQSGSQQDGGGTSRGKEDYSSEEETRNCDSPAKRRCRSEDIANGHAYRNEESSPQTHKTRARQSCRKKSKKRKR